MDTKESLQDATKPVAQGDDKGQGSMSNVARIATLVAGDALVFLVFSVIGRRSHSESAGLSSILDIIITAAPFAIAWFVVSPFVGAYRRGLEVQPRKMAVTTSLSWLAAWPLGLLLRWLFVGRVPPISFALITLISNLILLLVWRWPFAITRSSRRK